MVASETPYPSSTHAGATPNAGRPIWRPDVGGGRFGGAKLQAGTKWQRQNDGVPFGGGEKWRRQNGGAKMKAGKMEADGKVKKDKIVKRKAGSTQDPGIILRILGLS